MNNFNASQPITIKVMSEEDVDKYLESKLDSFVKRFQSDQARQSTKEVLNCMDVMILMGKNPSCNANAVQLARHYIKNHGLPVRKKGQNLVFFRSEVMLWLGARPVDKLAKVS